MTFILANLEWIGGLLAAAGALAYRFYTRRQAVKEDRREQVDKTREAIDAGARDRDRSRDARDARMHDRGLD